jgi:glycosyltransferase involved in cell wall biosynthesis
MMLAALARRLDRVIIVSPGQADVWRARGVARDRLALVANGVPAPAVPAGTREEVRRALGLAPDAVVAVAVASMRPVKRHADFVSGVRLAARDHPGLTGLVVGEGPDRPAIEAAGGGDQAVRLLGHRDDVPAILAAADLFVLASDYEAAPMAILEAMASGLPVIATAVGSVPEIVRDGETGLLVSPRQPEAIAQALARLVADPGLRAAMGDAGAARHRAHFSAEAMITGYEALLRAD